MTFRIGSGQGYYGDDVLKALPMILGNHVDVVCFEALAELTLAILQKDRLKDPSRGFTFDINVIASKILPEAYKRKIPLITNGGGLNPQGAAEAVQRTAQKLGLTGVKIAYVTGDDVMPHLHELQDAGETLAHLETGKPLDLADGGFMVNANVYLGAQPVVEALHAGADMVITGRVADPCIYLAPLIAHFGWDWDDWDKVASGIVCGHLLECTGQVVGGNSLVAMNSVDAADLPRLGYPIAHVGADGSFTITKTPDTPGMVTTDTVKEQLLYEVHDPSNYITPDVVADFTTLHLEQLEADHVRVTGVTGKPRPEKLKLNLGRVEGYMRELIFTVGWPDTWKKVNQIKDMLRTSWDGLPVDRVAFDYLGVNSLYGSVAELPDDPIEIVLRVTFSAADEDTIKTAVRRMMSNGLNGPAGMGVSGTTLSGTPRIVLGLWPTLVARDQIKPTVTYLEV